MSPAQVAKLVAVLMAAYPQSKLSTQSTVETSAAYERMLADLDYPAANAAVEKLIATSKWIPTVAEIREAVLSLRAGEVSAGGEAWGGVLRAIGRWGIYRVPGVGFQFDDAVTAECVSALSWRELCNSENPQADRARFIELYDRLAVRARQRQLSESLPAMQRFRALQAQQRPMLEARSEETKSAGELVNALVKSIGGDR